MRGYRALLHLYPSSFRREYGEEMEAIFAGRRRESSGPLGALALWGEAVLDVGGNALRVHLDLLRQDLRYAVRTLLRAPGFTATVVLVAALGVGATTVAFSIADHVLVRPLPFAQSGRLVQLWQSDSEGGYSRNELSPANYRDWKALSSSFESMGVYRNLSANLVGTGEPERLDGASMSAELLSVLRVRPMLGRAFAAADDREGATGTVLLSDGLWRARFGGDPDIVGQTVILDDEPHVVIGVMPPGFRFPNRQAEIWTAMRFAAQDFEERNNTYVYPVARLKDGVRIEQARAEVRVIAARLAREHPELVRVDAAVVPLRDQVSQQARLLLVALAGTAACVLLIACANLSSVLLARALVRRSEMAVRNALGAGRERLVRQLLTESLLLAVAGGGLGVLLAVTATPLVSRLVPTTLPIAEVPAADLRVLAAAAMLTVVTGIGFGLVPALRMSRDTDAAGLREGARAGLGGRKERLRSALVASEVAVSIVLLIAAGLLLRALWRVQGVHPGFRADGVLTLRTALPLPRYDPTATRLRFYDSVLADVRALPGVQGAAFISFLPMVMRGGIWSVTLDGRPEDPAERRPVSLRFATPGFFATMGIPLRAGRDLSGSDTRERPSVAVISESFARSYWPGVDPLGRRFRVAFEDREVIGVVGDVRVRGLERASEPQVYLPPAQVPDGALIFYFPKDLVIRTTADLATLMPALRRIVARADPQQPISDVHWLSDIVASDTAPRSVQARVLAAFAAVAVVLAGIGIHGLLAFTVSSRAQEIGVRMALGAGTRDIVALVMRQGIVLTAAGLAVGIAGAAAAGLALRALLAEVSPFDAVTFSTAVALVGTTTVLGCLRPTLRAVRVDPLTAIRAD
jgi:predicted permease